MAKELMTRDQAIAWLQKKVIPRIYNPKEEDMQALQIAIHDINEINKLGKKIEYYDKKGNEDE